MTVAGRGLRGLAIALVTMAIVLVMGLDSPIANAQTSDTVDRIELVDQSDWVVDGGSFRFEASVITPQPDDRDVVVSVFNPVKNRSDFQRSLEDRIAGSPLVFERSSLSAVLTQDGTAVVDLPVQDPTQRRYLLRNPGVYPVRVELQETGTGRSLDRFVTHLINLPQRPPVQNRLDVATVLPVRIPVSAGSSLTVPTTSDAGGVDSIGTSLASRPEVPVTVVPSPETFERLNAGTETRIIADSFRGDVASREVLRTTWGSVHPDVFSNAMSAELERQFERGTSVAGRLFPNISGSDWAAIDPIDSVALINLTGRGVSHVIVRESNLKTITRDTTLARPFLLSAGRNRASVPAAQADTGLASHFDDPGGPALTAHHLLADLAVIWNDRPAEARSVVVMPPSDFRASRPFLDIYLRALENSPLTAPVNLDQLFSGPTEKVGRTTLVRTLQDPGTGSRVPADRIHSQRQRWFGFASMVDRNNPVLDALDRHLLYSSSAGWDAAARSREIEAYESLLASQLGAIRVPSERALRLTSRTGEIPVSVQNDTGYPVHLVLTVNSDRLQFTEGNRRTLEIERQQVTERFAVEARSAGTFPVRVYVSSPDGSLEIGRSQVTLRSTVASGVGTALTVGAGGFLLVWWARSVIKSRRATRS